jgi:hypothetical protein
VTLGIVASKNVILVACGATLIVLGSACTYADDADEYVKQDWAKFHRLFNDHNLRPSWLCQGHEKKCKRLLAKLKANDFEFLAPVGYGDKPDSPIRKTVIERCPGLDTAESEQFPEPLKPTTGFALYELPKQLDQPSSEQLYIWRSENYLFDGRLVNDGLITVFTYADCKILRRHSVVKTHKSEYAPDAPGQETVSLMEPIIIDGKVLLLRFNAYNEGVPSRPPGYVLTLMSVLGDAKSGAEVYSFSGRGD